MFDALVKFAGQAFEAGRWNIAKRPAKELLAKGMVSSLDFGKLLICGGADFILHAVLSFGPPAQPGPDGGGPQPGPVGGGPQPGAAAGGPDGGGGG